jgi:hypothetical protein
MNLDDQRPIVGKVDYLSEFLFLKIGSALSFAWVDYDLDGDVLVVGIISILLCFAERDGWGESSFVFTGCNSAILLTRFLLFPEDVLPLLFGCLVLGIVTLL